MPCFCVRASTAKTHPLILSKSRSRSKVARWYATLNLSPHPISWTNTTSSIATHPRVSWKSRNQRSQSPVINLLYATSMTWSRNQCTSQTQMTSWSNEGRTKQRSQRAGNLRVRPSFTKARSPSSFQSIGPYSSAMLFWTTGPFSSTRIKYLTRPIPTSQLLWSRWWRFYRLKPRKIQYRCGSRIPNQKIANFSMRTFT